MINLQKLLLVSEDNPGAVDLLCHEHGLDPTIAHGVILLMIANDGNLAALSATQREHFDKTIAPLIA